MAAEVIAKRGLDAKDAVPALIEVLNNDDEYMLVCCGAAKALGEIRDEAAAPTLAAISEDDGIEDNLREEANKALNKIEETRETK